jgi:hypothetical protein
MAIREPPVSIERVRNRLRDALRHGETEWLNAAHGDALAAVDALATDLTSLYEAVAELEAEYAEIDATYRRGRERRVRMHGAGHPLIALADQNHEISRLRRLSAGETARRIVEPMDTALKNFLEGHVGVDELRAAAETSLGALSGAEPITVVLELIERLDRSIDPLGDQMAATEQYHRKIKLFRSVVLGFSSLCRTLRRRVEDELDLL